MGENSVEEGSITNASSKSTKDSLVSESDNKTKFTYNLENGKETAEYFRAYFGSEMKIQPYEFDEEQEINYMYPSIFTVTADVA